MRSSSSGGEPTLATMGSRLSPPTFREYYAIDILTQVDPCGQSIQGRMARRR